MVSVETVSSADPSDRDIHWLIIDRRNSLHVSAFHTLKGYPEGSRKGTGWVPKMLMSSADAPRALRQGRSLFGSGWKAVDSFEDLSDLEDYESEEEVSWQAFPSGTDPA